MKLKRVMVMSLLLVALVAVLVFGGTMFGRVNAETEQTSISWTNKIENAFTSNEDGSVLTVGTSQNVWADCIAYTTDLTQSVEFPYYAEARVQGLQASSETRLGVVALKNPSTFIRTHVCLRNGVFADMSHFGWLSDYIEGDNKDTGWQNIVNYADWGFTVDYNDFTIGAKYWLDNDGDYWVETYVDGNKIIGSEYNLTEKSNVANVSEVWNFGVFFCDQTEVEQTATFSDFKIEQLSDGEGEVDDHMFAGYEWNYSSLWVNDGQTLQTSNRGWRNNYLVSDVDNELTGSYVVSYTFQGTLTEILPIPGESDDFTRFGVIPWFINEQTFIVVELVWKASEAPYLTDICLQVNGKDPNGVAAGDPEWSDCWVVNWSQAGSVREYLPKDEFTLVIARLNYGTYDQYVIYLNDTYITTYNIFISATWGDAVSKTGMLTRGDTLTLKNFEIVKPTENDKPVISGYENAENTGNVGESVRLPSSLEAKGFMGCLVECIVSVKDPNGADVEIKSNKFTPEVAGIYTITISATDPWGVQAEVEYTVQVEGETETPPQEEKKSGCRSALGSDSAFVLLVVAICGIIVFGIAKKRD